MPKVAVIQSNFTAGEIAPGLMGRVDIAKYYNGAETLLNFIPNAYGNARARPGTYFVKEVKDSSKTTRLIPFQFSTEQAYILEFGHQYIRFYKDGGVITETAKNITGASQAAQCVITSASHGYLNGEEVYIEGIVGMTELNGKFYIVSDKDANTFKIKDRAGNYINSSAFTAWSSGGTAARVYTISTTFEETDLVDLQFCQDADVMYIVHPDFKPKKLSRTGHAAWTIVDVDFTDGPYLPDNTSTVLITPSAATGSAITLTASAPAWAGTTAYHKDDYVTNGGSTYKSLARHTSSSTFADDLAAGKWVVATLVVFYSTHVGALWKIKTGWVKITAYTSGTVVTAEVQVALGTTTAETDWAEGAWSDKRGWPSCVGFFEQRLFFASNGAKPQTAWGSYSGEYENFQEGAEDSDAVSYTPATGQQNKVRWILGGKALGLGTAGGVLNMSGGSSGDPITPSNVAVKLETTYGTKQVLPKKIGNYIYYIQRGGRVLREFEYSFEKDAYLANDMSLLSNHILRGGAIEMDYQQTPDNILWIVRADGVLVSMTREIEQEVTSWARHIIGGAFGTGAAIVESVAVIPNEASGYDEVWLIVKRTIDGTTRRYIEYITPILDFDLVAQEDAFFVDCGLTYDGSATSAITGLDHLEGQVVAVLTDGATHPNCTVTNGAIALQIAAEVVQVGLAYNSDLKTVRPEAGSAQGSSQGKTKRAYNAVARLHNTGCIQIGKSFTELDRIEFRTSDMNMDAPPDLFTGDTPIHPNKGFSTDGQICIRRDLPLPCNILALILKLQTNDD